MNQHYRPGSEEFLELFRTFERSAWRLETLQQYGASGEDERLLRFQRGEPYQQTGAKEAWLSIIREALAAGRSIGRIHVVEEPLSDYMRYELSWGYSPNVAAGEDIRIIPARPGEWPEGVPREDFWLFDDRLYFMHYALDGTWLDVEHVSDSHRVTRALETQQRVLERGMPYHEYMRRHPDLRAGAVA